MINITRGSKTGLKHKMDLVLIRRNLRKVWFSNGKPTRTTCGKRYYVKCLTGTSGCVSFGEVDHQVSDCPTIAARRREAKQVPPNGRL